MGNTCDFKKLNDNENRKLFVQDRFGIGEEANWRQAGEKCTNCQTSDQNYESYISVEIPMESYPLSS